MLIATELCRRDVLEFPPLGDTPPGVGGFVLGDSFEQILRALSPEYLAQAFDNLLPHLNELELQADDLGWGWMHPGHTFLHDTPSRYWPSDYIGWTTPQYGRNWRSYKEQSEKEKEPDAQLQHSNPSLRLASTYRGRCYKKSPHDFALGVRFVQHFCTDEVSDWHPDVVLTDTQNSMWPREKSKLERSSLDVWQLVALALEENDQHQLDEALDRARHTYSPEGYCLVWRGYRHCIQSGSFASELRWPDYPT